MSYKEQVEEGEQLKTQEQGREPEKNDVEMKEQSF